jgi:hypothetical protein
MDRRVWISLAWSIAVGLCARPSAAQIYVPVSGLPGGTAPPTVLAAAAGPETAMLQWMPCPEADVVGYNLYAATDGESFYPVNEFGPIESTFYLDTGLVNGATYYYCVTAVTWYGGESDPSALAWVRPHETPLTPRLGVRLEALAGSSAVGAPISLRISVMLGEWAVPGARVTLSLPDGSTAQVVTNGRGQALFQGYVPYEAGPQSVLAHVHLNHQDAEAAWEFEAAAPAS